MSAHEIGEKPATCLGIDLSRPEDRSAPDKWPHIENVVALYDSTIQPRPGLGTSPVATAPASETPWHSIRTLNDPTGGAGVWSRIYGIGDRLCDERSSAPGTINDLLGGFSGNPLSMVPARPSESPQPYMYVADSLLMRKVDRSGNLKRIGLPAPATAPAAQAYGTGNGFRTIDLMTALGTWVSAGVAIAPTLLSAATRPVNTTVTGYAESLTTPLIGEVTIYPASMVNIVEGSVLSIATTAGTHIARVDEVFSGAAAVAITAIRYDAGTSGFCSMILAVTSRVIRPGSVLALVGAVSGGSERIYVDAVLEGDDDSSICIRTYTAGARVAGDTVEARAAFAVRMSSGAANDLPTIGGAVTNDGILTGTSAATPAATPATISKVVALDLSGAMDGGTSTGIINQDAIMSIGVRVSSAAQSAVSEIRIMLDCASDSVTAGAFTGTECTKEYYLKVLTPSDLSKMLEYAESAINNRQTQATRRGLETYKRKVIQPEGPDASGHWTPDDGFYHPDTGQVTDLPPGEDAGPPRGQLTGGPQWYTANWRLSEMQRIGTGDRGWRDIVGIRIAMVTTAGTTIEFASWIIHGGFEPEASFDNIEPGYLYRYFGYDSSTGVRSNTSPASLRPIYPKRQKVRLALTQHPSSECDKLAIERWGGPADVLGWHHIATIANSASPSFTDTVSNAAARAAFESEPSGLTYCQPWPLPQKPLVGTGAVVTGNLVYVAAAPFNTSWLRGSQVIANSKLSLLRRVISTSLIEVEGSLGYSASSAYEIPRPVLTGQSLPILAGGDWDENRMIGLGDPADPSAYYLTRRGNYDATYELLRYEIPGAVLQNALIYNGNLYVWSTENLYRIEPAGIDPQGNPLFRAVVVPGARGLIARWACCVGDLLYWLSRDGICASGGAAPRIISDDDLYPLFPHSGLAGIAVRGINPPLITAAQEPNLRLSYGDDRLRFLYVDSASARRELEYRIRPGDAPNGWYPHVYTPGIACAYYEEGPGKRAWLMGGANATTAKLYQLTDAQSDEGTAITYSATPQYEDLGNGRIRKRFSDFTTELDRDGATVSVTPKFDNGATALAAISITTGTGRQIRVHDLNSAGVVAGSGVLATNMAITLGGTVTTERPRLHRWVPTWLNRPAVTKLRATDFEDYPPAGDKLVRGIWLTYDALGNTRAVSIYRDGNLTTAVTTISGITSASGPTRKFFPFGTPFYAAMLLVLPTDAAEWMLFGVELVADPAPPLSDGPQEWLDLGGARWIHSVTIDADTLGASVSVVVEGDEGVTLATITGVDHDGRAQKCYTFDPPLLTHLVRLNPASAIRLWPTPPTRWDLNPEPELAEHYETQQTTHDIPERYKMLRDALITLRSTSTVTFSIYDGALGPTSTALFTTTIPTTAGLRKPVYVPIAACKAASFIYVLDGGGTGFALYRRDTWVRVRGWGRTVAILGGEQASNWMTDAPFGGEHRATGAPT